MKLVQGMKWPPSNMLTRKMEEHSAWFSGDAEVLANFYSGFAAQTHLEKPAYNESFWGRQLGNQGEIFVHVPVANDIATTSADLLFANSPTIKVSQYSVKSLRKRYESTQKGIDDMLVESGFFPKIIEGAESCAGIGGVVIKLAWDKELSKYPIPVVTQADRVVTDFKFGILTQAIFHKVIEVSRSESKVYRHLEIYEKGTIRNELWLGSAERLGHQIALTAHPDTAELEDVIDTFGEMLCVYVPNMLPNRLDRSSYLGRSDFHGIEGLMDSLDDIFSSWLKDIVLAKAKILVPESFLDKRSGTSKFNVDAMIYEKLNMDPMSANGNPITPQQFAIRADEFEKSANNFLERIVTSAGYSPQSFGLSIEGRAESGTALNVREKKSYNTRSKKENYWGAALKKLVEMMTVVYVKGMGGKLEMDSDINVEFSDESAGTMSEISTSVKMLHDAKAASLETRIRMVHPDWDEEQIEKEVAALTSEASSMMPPDGAFNLDNVQTQKNKQKEDKDPDPEE